VGAPSTNGSVVALRFFFTVTLDRPEMATHLTFVREPRRIPVVLSLEEIARLLEATPGPKYKAALSAAYGAGLRVHLLLHRDGLAPSIPCRSSRRTPVFPQGADILRGVRDVSNVPEGAEIKPSIHKQRPADRYWGTCANRAPAATFR
jgi:hypothetical protein